MLTSYHNPIAVNMSRFIACCRESSTTTLIADVGTKLRLFFLQQRSVRRHFESPGMFSDDDANSDASSACSERSYSSRNGAVRHTEDVAEILNHCASTNWSERKEGLLGLQNVLRNHRMLRLVTSNPICLLSTSSNQRTPLYASVFQPLVKQNCLSKNLMGHHPPPPPKKKSN